MLNRLIAWIKLNYIQYRVVRWQNTIRGQYRFCWFNKWNDVSLYRLSQYNQPNIDSLVTGVVNNIKAHYNGMLDQYFHDYGDVDVLKTISRQQLDHIIMTYKPVQGDRDD